MMVNTMAYLKKGQRLNKTVYITVGCSGSGKSTLWRNEYPDAELLEPDQIRKEFGNISDQNNEVHVWKVFQSRFEKLLHFGKDIYISAMHLSLKSIKSELNTILKIDSDYSVKLLLLEISRDWELCLNRVKKDLEDKVDRSATSDIIKNGIPLIQDMSNRYVKMVDSKEFQEMIDKFSQELDIEVIKIG